jgi:hypothetical protein
MNESIPQLTSPESASPADVPIGELCWLCGEFAECAIAPHLIGLKVYSHNLCPQCQANAAERIQRSAA